MDNILEIASLNCRGLGDFVKRKDVFCFLREKNFSVYFLQDTHFTGEMEERVKREWGYDVYFSNYAQNSRGVAILIKNNFEYKLIDSVGDINGNFLVIRIKAFEKEFVLANVYGPNEDKPEFYTNLEDIISSFETLDNIIIAGDWNLVMDYNLDYCNYKRKNNVHAREKVIDVATNLDLIDIWRENNPDSKRFTWRRSTPFQQSRLDFFLISSLLSPFVKKTDILPGYKTDHSLITLTFQFGQETKRNTFWKFNTSLLHDLTYLKEINTLIEEIIEEYAVYPYAREKLKDIPIEDIEFTISDQIFLDLLLMKIRAKSISYSSFLKKKFTQKETTLLKEINSLETKNNPNAEEQETLKSMKDELINIREHRLKGVLLRSKARWVEDGEKVTSYFCSLEKRNYVNKCMNKITLSNDIEITTKDDILKEVMNFYKSLYSKRDVQDANISNLVKNLPKLNDNQSQQLGGELTFDEISYTLKSMKNEKSPGSDGFPVEFFKVFWKRLGGLVLRSLNEGFRKGEMSNTQKEAVIICLPKSDKDRDKLKNWRPISLLNTVYKIGSGSIANRIKPILPDIINDDQTGFIRGRYIGDNIRLISDIISYLTTENKPGLILCLDFEKAFDSLDWGFLFKVLEEFGFHNDIIRWIRSFYSGIKSSVTVNGMISEWFSVTRGCRQGDPISPYLFIICAEIMGNMIRENQRIKGIKLNDNEFKLTQYADDSEVLLEGDRQSFEETVQTIQQFSNVSGLKLNSSKTNVIWLGSSRNSNVRYMQHLDMSWNPETFKILGIIFTNDLHDVVNLNFQEKIKEMKYLYKVWIKRQITPLGRVAVLKSLILSKLIYLWILLPNPPDHLIFEIQSEIFKFVWNNKNHRINRQTASRNLIDGGIGMINVVKYIQALKITWVRKLANTNHKWKTLLMQIYPKANNLSEFGTCLPIDVNEFWCDVFKSYKTFGHCIKPETDQSFLSEPIFL